MAIRKTTKTITTEIDVYTAECELCSSSWEISEDDASVMDSPDRVPLVTVTASGADTHIMDLCDRCEAFVLDGLDKLLTPISRARRYGAQKPASDDPPADPSEDAGEGGDGAESKGEAS